MALDAITLVSIAAILIMLYALWQVIRLKRRIPGGVVGRSWRILFALVLLFAVGYIAMPLVGELSLDALRLVVAVVFLFGAVYVVITIGLIRRIIQELSD